MDHGSELQRYMEIILRRRWIVLSFAAALFAAVAAGTLARTPVYEATALLLIEKERQERYGYREGTLVESSQDDYYQSQYSILRSRSLANKTAQALGPLWTPRFKDARQAVEALKESIRIEPVRRTRLVRVSAESPDPLLAASVANALAGTYVRQNQASRLFISKEILAAIRAGRAPGSSSAYESLPSIVNNRLIQELKIRHAALETEIANLSRRYTPKYPALARLRRELVTLRERIDSEVHRIAASVEAELSGQLQGNNVRILDPAQVPLDPVRPRVMVNLSVALLFGLVLGPALALLMDRLDRTIRSQEDVEQVLKLPFLGSIPRIASRAEAPWAIFSHCVEHRQSASAESFRNLRTAVALSSPDGAPRSVLVTSTVSGEGKSVVACNLAAVFAQLGERVLLIDGDLRRPTLHKAFALSEAVGLSSYLAGKEEPGRCVFETGVENLRVLPSGPRPPDPSELLSTPRIMNLLAWASDRFDRVVIDSPPVFPVSDALLWSKYARGVLFVAQSGKVNAALSRRACQKLAGGRARLVGCATNQVMPGHSGSGYYYYYYAAYEDEAGRSAPKGAAARVPGQGPG